MTIELKIRCLMRKYLHLMDQSSGGKKNRNRKS